MRIDERMINSDVHKEFRENISKDEQERYEVGIPWVPGAEISENNELQSRKRLQNVERKLERNPKIESIFYNKDEEVKEWDTLLSRKSYWTTLRIGAWVLRFVNNSKAKKKSERVKGPLTTEEINKARVYMTVRAQRNKPGNLQRPGWKLERDPKTGILKCAGRVNDHQPMYLEDGEFTHKLIRHEHESVGHLGVASTMAALRENWHILNMRAQMKRSIR